MRLTPPGRFVAVLSVIALAAAYLLGYPRLAAIGIGGLVALAIGSQTGGKRSRGSDNDQGNLPTRPE